MGFRLMERVWAIPPGYLAPDERLVLSALAFKANDQYDVRPTAWPSEKTLAAMCGWTNTRRVRERLSDLQEANWIRKGTDRESRRRRSDGTWPATIWILNLPPEWTDGGVHDLKPTRKAQTRRKNNLKPAEAQPMAEDQPQAETRHVERPKTSRRRPAEDQPRGAAEVQPPIRRGTEEGSETRNSHHVADFVDDAPAARLGEDKEDDLELRKREAVAALHELEERWSMEGST